MRQYLLPVLVLGIGLIGCDSPTDPRERVVEIQADADFPPYARSVHEIATPLRFRAVDAQGQGVGGVRLEFSTWEDHEGRFSAIEGTTDSEGYVETRYTTGPVTGEENCRAWVAAEGRSEDAPCASLNLTANLPGTDLFGRVSTTVIRLDRLELTPDTLRAVADGRITSGGFDAAVLDPQGRRYLAISVDYVSLDTTVLALWAHTGSSETYRGQRSAYQAKRPGTTKVIASFAGATDTTMVEVGAAP